MAQYSATAVANLLASTSVTPPLVSRVQAALIKHGATRYSSSPTVDEKYYLRRLANNSAGEANAALPLILSVMAVAAPGTDTVPTPPTDAELSTSVASLWNFLVGQ